MKSPGILVIDCGTSSSRAVIYDPAGQMVLYHSCPTTVSRPGPDRVEADPVALLAAIDQVLTSALAEATDRWIQIEAIALASQRSSFLAWDTGNNRPMTPILSWADARAASLMDRYQADWGQIVQKTGVTPSPYYGGPKWASLVMEQPDLAQGMRAGNVKFIPVETLIIHHLTGNYFIDESLAGRTMCFDIPKRQWDANLVTLFGLMPDGLPDIVTSFAEYGYYRSTVGEIPLRLALGDQQAAMYGLGARNRDELAINFGTSASVALNLGPIPRLEPGLLTNIAYSDGQSIDYLLEGTINGCGSLMRWLGDQIGNDKLVKIWDDFISASTDLILIPGINGLAAPYWQPHVPTTFIPDAEYPVPDKVRAAMESIGFLIKDITEAMEWQPAGGSDMVHCGGGMARPPMLQFVADLLDHPVARHPDRNVTAFGAASRLAARLGYDDFDAEPTISEELFSPTDDRRYVDARIMKWRTELGRIIN
ncbi:FGGY family carbohydrate kinase [Candidatus Neomarinimicrobiota bacterium]